MNRYYGLWRLMLCSLQGLYAYGDLNWTGCPVSLGESGGIPGPGKREVRSRFHWDYVMDIDFTPTPC